MKKLYVIVTILVALSLALTACGAKKPSAPATQPPAAPATQPPAAPTDAPKPAFKVGEVTDMGGVDDKSFNGSAWKGVQDAVSQLGIEGKYLESQQQSDYAKNIQQYLDEDTNLIVTVGFLLGVDTAKAAIANPDQKFAIVDYSFPDCWPGAKVGVECGTDQDLPNVRGLMFQTDQAAFMAGYLAAGMTQTGKVATFGGLPLPTVTIFMKGFEAGVKYYNQQKGANVEVLGWNDAKGEGSFVNNFDSLDDGRAQAESFVQEGADIILPVAGPVGQGSAAYCKETGACMIIGVDADWYETVPQYKDVILSSVIKKIDVAVFNTIKDVMDGTFTGGVKVYTIVDGGVDLAPFHDLDSKVSAELKAELDAIKKALIDGSLTVDGVLGK
jgi:basic membrane protein A